MAANKTNFYRLLAGLFLLGSVIIGCTGNTGPTFEPAPVVFAVLNAGDSLQEIIVDQTYGIEDSVSQVGVIGASVWVFGNGDSVQFIGEDYYPEVYAATVDSSWLKPNTDYTLRVILPPDVGVETVWATTRVPGRFHITGPDNQESFDWTQLPLLTWTPSPGCYLYHIWIFPETDSLLIDSLPFYFRIPQSTSDTVLDLATMQSYFAWLDTNYVIRVNASEENYYHYLREDTITNLSHGLGVFGGRAEDSVKIYLRHGGTRIRLPKGRVFDETRRMTRNDAE
jgi:hypothetical protein